jgi:hypothetical protein
MGALGLDGNCTVGFGLCMTFQAQAVSVGALADAFFLLCRLSSLLCHGCACRGALAYYEWSGVFCHRTHLKIDLHVMLRAYSASHTTMF